MAHADAGMRALSLGVSAALLGAALIGAMSMRFAIMESDAPADFAGVEMVRPPEPDPPPQTPARPQEPPPVVDDQFVIFEAPQPMDVAEMPTATELPAFSPPQPAEVTDPRWTRRPRDLSRFYPARARSAGIEGEVVLDCAVSAQGALNCAVARETPAGWGFGEAAQRIAREHRMVPASRAGQPVEARYRMRLPFQLD